jgi:hypothetical protein
MGTVKFGYAAASNISFRGVRDSGVAREDWDEMTGPEQDEVLADVLFDLVEIWEEADTAEED